MRSLRPRLATWPRRATPDSFDADRRRLLRVAPLAALAAAWQARAEPAEAATGAAAAPAWSTAGNALTKAGVLGSTTKQPLIVRTAGTERLRVTTSGLVGVGTSSPVALLHSDASAAGVLGGLFESAGTADALRAVASGAGASAVAGYLDANDPGDGSAVSGQVITSQGAGAAAVRGQHSGAGDGVYGETSTGSGVHGVATAAGTGVVGSTSVYNGLAGSFTNLASSGGTYGTALRALTPTGSYARLRRTTPGFAPGFAAAEFSGQYGIIAAAGGSSAAAGVLGLGPGVGGAGVVGHGLDGDDGVLGRSDAHGNGVAGLGLNGVLGSTTTSFGAGGAGVVGEATGDGSTAVAAYASSSALGLDVLGDAAVQGSLSKSGGSFRIDHPLDPDRKYLSHSFVESPDMKNVYDGIVVLDAAGRGSVELPDWFEPLNRDLRYQLTPLGAPAPDLHVSAEVAAGRFSVAGGGAGQRVCWQVTGVRQDAWAQAHRIPVEHDKAPEDVGRHLHPELLPNGRPLARVQRRLDQLTRARRANTGATGTPAG